MSAVDTTCGCGHSVVFHHDQRGCGYFGFGQDRCICKNDPTAAVEQIVQRLGEEAVVAFKVAAAMALDRKATEWAEEFAETDSDANYGRWDAWENAARIVRNHPT